MWRKGRLAMDPGYTNVVDPLTIIPPALAMGVHVAVALAQLGLAIFLITTGARGLLAPLRDSRLFGGVRLTLGVLLVSPLLLAAASLVSLVAGLGAFVLLLYLERTRPADRKQPGRLVRRTAIAAAAGVALFMFWEGEDSLDLCVGLVTNMNEWRAREVEWQLRHDMEAPKVGDPAPDFELQDPSGATAVRLSDFRGKRPVALVFGSYT